MCVCVKKQATIFMNVRRTNGATLLVPRKMRQRVPLVLNVPGGGYVSHNLFPSVNKAIQDRVGGDVVTVLYDLPHQGDVDATRSVRGVRSALRWAVREHPGRVVFLFGVSAGAHACATVVNDPKYAAICDAQLLVVPAMVPGDVTSNGCTTGWKWSKTVTSPLPGMPSTMYPTLGVTSTVPRTAIVYSESDPYVSTKGVMAYVKQLKTFQVPVVTVPLKNAPHSAAILEMCLTDRQWDVILALLMRPSEEVSL